MLIGNYVFSLSHEREKYLSQKHATRRKMHQTIQYQISNREPELPKSYKDGEVKINNENFEKIKKM